MVPNNNDVFQSLFVGPGEIAGLQILSSVGLAQSEDGDEELT